MTEKELVAKMQETLVKSRKELANIDLGITRKSLPELDKIIEHLSAPLMIMVMGEFSTGKSTFINAMVGEEVTAVNATPTTAVITKLCYGTQDKILVHFTDGTEKEFESSSFKQLTAKTGKDNEDKTHEEIEYVERQMPLDMLQYVTIIDSPGLNDINEKHSDTTKKFVNNADTVFWMFNALHAASKTEVDALETLTPRLKPIAIINMMDEIDEEEDDPQEFLENLRVQLKDKVQAVVGISAKYALEGKLENNEAKSEIGNLKELEQVVRNLVLPKRDKFKLNTLMDELGEWIDGISYDLSEMEIINQKNKEIDYEDYLSLKEKIQQSKENCLNIIGEIRDYILVESHKFNDQAMFLLGVLYYRGICFSKIEEKAEQFLESAALKNHTLAQATLGILYFDKKDIKKARYWLEKAAEQDSKEALFGVGSLYFWNEKTGEFDFENGDEIKAIPFLEKAAALNEPNAQYLLFLLYRHGRGVEENQEKASEFLFKAAELEDEKALLALGEVYVDLFESADSEESKEYVPKIIYYFTKAAEYGNAEAIFNLGEIHRKYWQGDDRDQKALNFYKKAALLGNSDAQYWIARYYGNGIGTNKDEEQAFEWYKKSAEQGNADAQNMLGRCYVEGWGTDKDDEQAVEWYRKSAEQGNEAAQCNLAGYYHAGKVVKQDYGAAFKWFKESAEQGVRSAQNMLGRYYEEGWGTEKDEKQAVEWYRKAAEQGYEMAQRNLAVCYEFGRGVQKDLDQAIEWYRKAAEQGNEDAKIRADELEKNKVLKNANDSAVGGNYREELPTKAKKNALQETFEIREATRPKSQNANLHSTIHDAQNETESYFNECKSCAESGDVRKQYELAVCYAAGDGIPKNLNQAFYWYQKSAYQGYAQAQYALATCYLKGMGTDKNISNAKYWYEKAAAQGYSKAELELQRMGYANNSTKQAVHITTANNTATTITNSNTNDKPPEEDKNKFIKWGIGAAVVIVLGVFLLSGNNGSTTKNTMGVGTNTPNYTTKQNYTTTKKEVVPEKTSLIIGTDVNARSSNSMQSSVIGSFGFGEKVILISEQGEWAKVRRANGTECYVARKFLGTQEDYDRKLSNALNIPAGVGMTAYHSSADQEGNYSHSGKLAVDGNVDTCWSEGVKGLGIGENIEIQFNSTYKVNGLNIWIGHQKTQELFYQNARPTVIRVLGSDGSDEVYRLRDAFGGQRLNFRYPITVNKLKIVVVEAAQGTKYEDTCIAEVNFF